MNRLSSTDKTRALPAATLGRLWHGAAGALLQWRLRLGMGAALRDLSDDDRNGDDLNTAGKKRDDQG